MASTSPRPTAKKHRLPWLVGVKSHGQSADFLVPGAPGGQSVLALIRHWLCALARECVPFGDQSFNSVELRVARMESMKFLIVIRSVG